MRSARTGWVVASVAVALAACETRTATPLFTNRNPTICLPDPNRPPLPVVNVGPDATIRVPCGGSGTAVIATLSAVQGGPFDWRATVNERPDAFTIGPNGGTACVGDQITFVTATFRQPYAALPGDAFDTTVTIFSPEGAFSAETVHLRGEILTGKLEIPSMVDFGDIPVGVSPQLPITFEAGGSWDTIVRLVSPLPAPFSLSPYNDSLRGRGSIRIAIVVDASTPGTFEADSHWELAPLTPDGATQCETAATIKLRARVFSTEDGGAGDAGEGE